MKKEKKEFRTIEYLVIFLLAWLPRLFFIALHHQPFRTPMDEMVTLSSAAFGAGYDWSALVVSAKHYYGGGFTILFSPLLKSDLDSVSVFAMILSVYAVMQSISAPIACYITKKYLKITKRTHLYLISLVSSYLVVARTQTTLNEHALIGIMWIIWLLLCKLVEQEEHYQKKAFYTVLLFFTMSYALTIHARTKMLWIAIGGLIICYYLFRKKWLVAKVPAMISGAIGYYGAGKFVDWIKKSVWLWQEGEPLKNTEVSINITKDMLAQSEFYQGVLSTIVGQVHTSFTFTCGLTAIAFVVVWSIFFGYAKGVKKKQEPWTEEENAHMKYILVSVLFFGVCIVGTIFAQSLSWAEAVMDALQGGRSYGFKAYTYIRYYGIYLGPFFYGILMFIYFHMEELKGNLQWCIRIFVWIEFLFLLIVFPYIKNNNVASEVYWPFALWSKFRGDVVRFYVYLIGVALSASIFFVSLYLLKKKKYGVYLCTFLAILVVQYGWNAYYWDGNYMENFEAQTNAGYAFIKELEKDGFEVPEEIYVKSTAPMGQDSSYVYQMLLREYKLIPKVPDSSEKNVIILCNQEGISKVQKKQFKIYVLDDNEFVATNWEKLIQCIEEKGLKKYTALGQ